MLQAIYIVYKAKYISLRVYIVINIYKSWIKGRFAQIPGMIITIYISTKFRRKNFLSISQAPMHWAPREPRIPGKGMYLYSRGGGSVYRSIRARTNAALHVLLTTCRE